MTVVSKAPKTIGQLGIQSAATWARDNATWLRTVIEKHETGLKDTKVEVYQAAYDGELETIITRDKARDGGTENKLQVNLAQVIIDTPVDYMLGKPPAWTVEDPEAVTNDTTGEITERPIVIEYREKVLKLLIQRDIQRVLSEQLRHGSIAGESPVISWVDETGKIDFEEYPINECIVILDTRGRFVMMIRHYKDDVIEGDKAVPRTRLEIYDEKYITYYIGDDTGQNFSLDSREFDMAKPVVTDAAEEAAIYEGNPIPHMAGRIPVSLFINGQAASYKKRVKRAGTSDLGNGVLSLLEALAHGMSDKANLAEYLQDQYLLLKGVNVDEGEVIKMRKARALALNDKESDASFIAQDQADGAIENYLNRLENLIYDQTFTPKLKDLAGATATEVKMKYANLDIKTGKKEIYFKGAIKHLIDILTDFLNAQRLIAEGGLTRDQVFGILSGQEENNTTVELYDPDWMAVTINRNLPQNYQEIATIVSLLAEIVPESYLYELLWFIEDPKEAIKEMKAQRAAKQKEAMDSMYASSENGDFTDPNREDDPANTGGAATA